MRAIDADRLLEDMNVWNWNELHRIEDFARLVVPAQGGLEKRKQRLSLTGTGGKYERKTMG